MNKIILKQFKYILCFILCLKISNTHWTSTLRFWFHEISNRSNKKIEKFAFFIFLQFKKKFCIQQHLTIVVIKISLQSRDAWCVQSFGLFQYTFTWHALNILSYPSPYKIVIISLFSLLLLIEILFKYEFHRNTFVQEVIFPLLYKMHSTCPRE